MRDPFKLPDTPDPTQSKASCPVCNATLQGPNVTSCPSCGNSFPQPIIGDIHPHKAPDRKQKVDNFNIRLQSKEQDILEAKKKEKTRVSDDFKSDEFKQCIEHPNQIKRKKNKFDDNKLRDVWKSCTDLEIDG
ncbi:MAG: hypothetical protein J7L15_01220 [Clostridiales bacterium]|nr:hypothetical protein [Clostridiales bacterium]